MLSARAYSFRQKSKLAVSLSWVAGYANVVILLACGTVVSHATGNTAHIATEVVGQGPFASAWAAAFLVLCFFCGAIASAFMTEGAKRRGWRSKYLFPVTVEAALLTLLAVALAHHHHV